MANRKSNDVERANNSSQTPILVSACLLGVNCVYDGGNNRNERVVELSKRRVLIPICPEQLGGLSTPRIPSCIIKGSGEDVLEGRAFLINQKGEDVTKFFLRGAEEALKIAKVVGAKEAILKERSPSCGIHQIYNKKVVSGEEEVKGCGVTVALFLRKGIKVRSDEEIL